MWEWIIVLVVIAIVSLSAFLIWLPVAFIESGNSDSETKAGRTGNILYRKSGGPKEAYLDEKEWPLPLKPVA